MNKINELVEHGGQIVHLESRVIESPYEWQMVIRYANGVQHLVGYVTRNDTAGRTTITYLLPFCDESLLVTLTDYIADGQRMYQANHAAVANYTNKTQLTIDSDLESPAENEDSIGFSVLGVWDSKIYNNV